MKNTCSNQLFKEQSPYLLQHKDNPVWWYAWGDVAFKRARLENKPIFLSIGYSTCHWCHVMEKESFEDFEVAQALNQDFVSIKVDREERPDVDKIYMDAVVAMTGQGGWPMSVFLTADLKPFYAGTYFPKHHFLRLLSSIHKAWTENRSEVSSSSEKMADYLKKQRSLGKSLEELPGEDIFTSVLSFYQRQFDAEHGGFGDAPKFPQTSGLELLLRLAARKLPHSLEMVEKTLKEMAYGGIYDHLGGGFARYSTDRTWLVPHFEKMLYDNALLSAVYFQAWDITQENIYRSVACETLNYVLRDMSSSEGGFYCAEDADSESVEGKYYVWKRSEIENILKGKKLDLFLKAYGVTQSGNFEHETNILHLQKDVSWDLKKKLVEEHRLLFEAREKRIHPHKDDKVLTDWNGLMVRALCLGYQSTKDLRYLRAAQKTAYFIKEKLFKNKILFHRYRHGEAGIEGLLSDYAYLIEGLLCLYEVDEDKTGLLWAQELQSIQNQKFWDASLGGYFFTEERFDLIRRSKEFSESSLPNENAVSALNLFKLCGYFKESDDYERGKKILMTAGLSSVSYPPAYASILVALDCYREDPRTCRAPYCKMPVS
ncbi:MAG: thioredoxin domain-containing protein [Deltaproteobacteria bacterium]|nr:thioredoxin domain-containing protein [Deltaproteobacteria bacterium]